MAPAAGRTRLAHRLRELREKEWPDVSLTQAQLAEALNVAPATLSSWESLSTPKTPPPARLDAIARFYCTRRSLEGRAHVLSTSELDEEERARFNELRQEFRALHDVDEPVEQSRRALLSFEGTGPVVIICPELPKEAWGVLADEDDPNFTRLYRYADPEALLEIFGHVRALNPGVPVLHRLPSTVASEELQYHLVVIGGIGWNRTMRRILAELAEKLPIEQVEHPDVPTGEVFRVRGIGTREEQMHFPRTEEVDDGVTELVEDVALLARLDNPFNSSRTLTICNGVHSRGVLGAVYAMSDETVRPANEEYIAKRFPDGPFAMLLRVPVVSGKVLAPDLQNPDVRLFEWAPE
jgi:transcriptional regulator with XRE-family HTH domain